MILIVTVLPFGPEWEKSVEVFVSLNKIIRDNIIKTISATFCHMKLFVFIDSGICDEETKHVLYVLMFMFTILSARLVSESLSGHFIHHTGSVDFVL